MSTSIFLTVEVMSPLGSGIEQREFSSRMNQMYSLQRGESIEKLVMGLKAGQAGPTDLIRNFQEHFPAYNRFAYPPALVCLNTGGGT